MRQRRTYRSDRKRRARDRGISLQELDRQDARAKELAAQRVHQIAMAMTPEESRRALAIWSKSGGKINIITGEGCDVSPQDGQGKAPETSDYRASSHPREETQAEAIARDVGEGTVYPGQLGIYGGVKINGRR